MKAKCVIDIYSGKPYEKGVHLTPCCYWSDGLLRYWGWIYNNAHKIVGDWHAERLQDAEKALGVKFNVR